MPEITGTREKKTQIITPLYSFYSILQSIAEYVISAISKQQMRHESFSTKTLLLEETLKSTNDFQN